ncbi:anti-CBASS protein Acb1 family protein [Enterobacter hormaechei]|uniref:anti-CBASS protein Acb1 family protein n=1 Tax=Enterobacter hormaechei TaxID=158836 RepID=UPI002E2AB254|nr:anti-CBASS Acb1 family protein [Enterobacter hormaechei]MED5625611.1 anti-CBASS Acb1 family protein [Enterobacter hormaechei]
MTDKLTLAVNHALNDARMARARMGLMAPTMGLDNKRHSAWCEYGFPEQVTYENLYALYRRGGIAHGAVEKLVGKCWQTNPEIIEGDQADKKRKETAWEKKSKQVFTNRFWRSFSEADRRRLVGRYAGILLHIRDEKDWSLPVTKGRGLQKISVAWAGSLTVGEWDTGLNSQTYGQPKMWQYAERLPNGSSRRVNIHPDRVFILGDYSDDAIGFLEPAYNAFVSLEKVEGGSGESFLKNAARQLALSFDKEIDFANLASMYSVSVDELQDRFNDAAREMNRGNDVLLSLQGASVTSLVSPVSDPSPTYDVNLQTAAAGVDIPTRILVGNQQAERSSTEDQKYFNTRCQSRRGDLSFEIEDFCDKLIELSILDPVSQQTVIWDDLNAQSDSEKLDAAQKMSQINSASIGTGEQVFTGEEIRVAAGYEGSPEPLPEVDDDEEESEVTDTSGKP